MIITKLLDINVASKLFLFFLYLYLCVLENDIKLNIQQQYLNTKVCICTLGKNENKYILEFVEHYKKYGIDKIFLYDNNDIDGERFEDAIGKYVENNFTEIIDWRGVKGNSTYFGIMDSCYQSHHNEFDWLIFYELDEFLYLKKSSNIKIFLANKRFDKCESIQLNWVHMSDNNQLFYEKKPLNQRFKQKGKNVIKNKYNKLCYVKSIIRGHLRNISITHNHFLSEKIKACDGFGKKSQLKGLASLNPDYEFNYIKHYYSKSVQEFIEKINRGDLLKGNSQKVINYAIEKFFYINEITLEKINYIQKHLGKNYNLTKFIRKLKK